ncbi:MAG: M56 family metallopeptidase [Bacteroidetes bacterium]|nr:M56 family metallopeptidase [Bacteroidota bacterium]
MEAYILYLLKSSLLLSILIIFYRFIFTKETYFSFNRIILLISLISSVFIFPFLYRITDLSVNNIPQVAVFEKIVLNPIVIYGNESASTNWLLVIFNTYLAIAGFLFLRLIFQIYQIYRLYLKSYSNQSTSNYIYTDDHPPFSFFNLIFINPKTNVNDIDKIIAHEQIHVKQFHTIDILLVETVCILHWFNPFVWWYRSLIREVHEYIADEGVINSGYEKQGYQELLLSVATSEKLLKPENNFNSLIKKRIIMMTKSKSKGISRAKYLLLIPVFIFISLFSALKTEQVYAVAKEKFNPGKDIALFTSITTPNAKPSAEQSQQKPKKQKADTKVYTEVDQIPEFKGGSSAMQNFIKENIVYPKAAREKGIMGTVYVTFIVEINGAVSEVKIIKGVDSLLDSEAVRVVKLMTKKWKAGMLKGKAVRVQFNLPIKFALN